LRIIKPAIRLRTGVTKMGVLLQCGIDGSDHGMAEYFILGEELQDSVANLLNRVLHAIGLADLCEVRGLIDRGFIPVQAEQLAPPDEILHHLRILRRLDVVIAGMLEAADGETGNVLARLKG